MLEFMFAVCGTLVIVPVIVLLINLIDNTIDAKINLRHALDTKSPREIENYLIEYDSVLNNKTKKALQQRKDDLILEASKEQFTKKVGIKK